MCSSLINSAWYLPSYSNSWSTLWLGPCDDHKYTNRPDMREKTRPTKGQSGTESTTDNVSSWNEYLNIFLGRLTIFSMDGASNYSSLPNRHYILYHVYQISFATGEKSLLVLWIQTIIFYLVRRAQPAYIVEYVLHELKKINLVSRMKPANVDS